jgi:hypothetical protein
VIRNTGKETPETAKETASHFHINVEEEEKKLLLKKGNPECKDDFWIGLS